MPQFRSLFYAILQSWRPKGGAMAQRPPPKYAPACFFQKQAFQNPGWSYQRFRSYFKKLLLEVTIGS